MIFSLLSILWFNQMNIYRTKTEMPRFCRWIVLRYVCYIMRTPDHKTIKVENMKNIISEMNGCKEKGIIFFDLSIFKFFKNLSLEFIFAHYIHY